MEVVCTFANGRRFNILKIPGNSLRKFVGKWDLGAHEWDKENILVFIEGKPTKES